MQEGGREDIGWVINQFWRLKIDLDLHVKLGHEEDSYLWRTTPQLRLADSHTHTARFFWTESCGKQLRLSTNFLDREQVIRPWNFDYKLHLTSIMCSKLSDM